MKSSPSLFRNGPLLTIAGAVLLLLGAPAGAATPSLTATEVVNRSVATTRTRLGVTHQQRESWRLTFTAIVPVAETATLDTPTLETVFAKGAVSLAIGDVQLDATFIPTTVNRTKRTATLQVSNGGDTLLPAGPLTASWNEAAFTIKGTLVASAANFIFPEDTRPRVSGTMTGSATVIGNVTSGQAVAVMQWQSIKVSGSQNFSRRRLQGEDFIVGTRQITATGDAVRPAVRILSPAADLRKDGGSVQDASIRLSGIALDNREVTGVVVKVDGGDEVAADFSHPTTRTGADILTKGNWSFDAGVLDSGLHTFEVYAIDLEGLRSNVAIRRIDYIKYVNLSVTVEGAGSVTSSFLANGGVTRREVRKAYTITATPQPGHTFAGWSGDLPGLAFAGPVLSFTMPDQPLVNLKARFVPNPFAGFEGDYSVHFGLGADLSSTDSIETFGSITFTMTPTGQITGKLFSGRTPGGVSFVAALNGDGTVTIDVPYAPLAKGQTVTSVPHLRLELAIDLTNSAQPQVTGAAYGIEPGVADSVFERGLVAYRKAFSATNPIDQALQGAYTFVIESSATTASGFDLPPGHATARVSADGVITMLGVLPDGASFSFSRALSPQGELFLLHPTATGVLVGSVLLEPGTFGPVVTASLALNYERFDEDLLQIVFEQATLTTTAEPYRAPAAGEPIIPGSSGNGSISITTYFEDDGNVFSRDIVKQFTVAADRSVTVVGANPEAVQLQFDVAKGTFSGSFVHPETGATEPFAGALLQSSSQGAGQYRLNGEAGPVILDFLSGDPVP